MHQIDLVIIGAGLPGCMAAIRAAEQGLKVVLVEKREYPGREIAANNHTFVSVEGERAFNQTSPTWLAQLFTMRDHREAMAPDGLTRQWLINALDRSGVTVLYSAQPAGLTRDAAGVTGVVLSTPLGVMHLSARKVIDATERLNLGRIVIGKPYVSGPVKVHAVFEMENMKGQPAGFEEIERQLGLVPGSMDFHPTVRNDTHVIQYAYMDEGSGLYGARGELETRRIAKSGQVAALLREKLPEFADASLSHHAYDALLVGDEAELPAIDGLESMDRLPWGFSLGEVAGAWAQAGRLVEWASSEPAPNGLGKEVLLCRGTETGFDRDALVGYEDDGLTVVLHRFQPEALGGNLASFETDICVIGSGAGGGMAMLAAAESGKRVAVVEVNTLMGGTHTVGRVTGYYDGYRSGMNQKVGEAAKAFVQAQGDRQEAGGIPHASYLNNRVAELGVKVFTASFACGALMEGNRVTGAVIANEDGLFAIRAKITIDATGNADMIAFAGADYEIGDPDTGMVQSYSLWGAELYPVNAHVIHRYLNDPGICHPDLYSERLRAIRDGHHKNTAFHISPMVTVRESRRVVGEHYLTVRDLLDDKLYDDVIAVACTRADSHAYTSSPLARLGGLGAGQEVKLRIPYGCFIPRGIEGLFVAAKAISGERDATSFCRMNADIKNAGYAVGLAASMAIDSDCGIREIDLPSLQLRLRELGILPDWAFAAQELPDIEALASKAADGDEEALIALLRRPEDKTLPVLERLYAEGRRGYTAHALGWFGSATGGEELAELLSTAVEEGRHRTLPMHGTYRGMFRWGKFYGDDYTLINRLIMFAGRSGDSRTVEPLARLIADTEGFGPLHPGIMPYDILREDMIRYPFFNRMLCIAYAAAAKADSRLAAALDALLAREGVTGHATDLRVGGHPAFMLAHAEVSLSRAAVRCGSALGAKVLSAYLTDVHSFFRRTARRELGLAFEDGAGRVKQMQAVVQ